MNKYNKFTVSEVNQYLKQLITDCRQLQNILIVGEISDFYRDNRSQHCYFQLKDQKSEIKVLLFASVATKVKFSLINGAEVEIFGSINLYQKGGTYAINCIAIRKIGIGALFLKYENNKQKIISSGLSSPLNKKIIPQFPDYIGVITAKNSACFKDIVNTIQRRYPIAEIFLFSSNVQGKDAYLSLITALANADNYCNPKLDVIIIGRGGGSFEDLNNFNNVQLIKAIIKSKTPIISGVGHESDHPLIDLIVDKAAVTPTAAAEFATPNINEIRKFLMNKQKSIYKEMKVNESKLTNQLQLLKNNYYLKNPNWIYTNVFNNVSGRRNKLNIKLISLKDKINCFEQIIIDHKHRIKINQIKLLDKINKLIDYQNIKFLILKKISDTKNILIYQKENLRFIFRNNIKNNIIIKLESKLINYKQFLEAPIKYKINNIEQIIINRKYKIKISQIKLLTKINQLNNTIINNNKQLSLLNPLIILKKGYSITYNQNKKIITTADTLKINEIIKIKFANKSVIAKVIKKEN